CFLILSIMMILIGSWLSPGLAGSYYNSRGFGELRYSSNAQAMGLGGSLVAVPDGFHINLVNPASLPFISVTRLSGDFIHEAIWSQTSTAEGFTKYTNLNGVSMALPIVQNKLTLALGLIPISQFDYDYSLSGSINDYQYRKTIRGTGGLNKIVFSGGGSVTKFLRLGVSFHYNFGKLEQTWLVDYTSDLFWDTWDKLTRKMWGPGYSAGILVRPTSNLFVGAVYAGSSPLTIQDHVYNRTQKGSLIGVIDRYKMDPHEVTMPAMWGIGMSYLALKKFVITSDIIYQPWADFRRVNQSATDYYDDYRIGGGIEMLPSLNMLAKYYQRMNYRLGYFYHELNFKNATGAKITEYGVTTGVGLPYYGSFGRVDVALRFGNRGTLDQGLIKETIFQLFISVSGGEKWFNRAF
ncbi:MAG: hypothetical protein ONB11_10620, partial [candidate division KSB1 bacterium]|nr:hypothetical protein [candidate division KSB1 bacterium]